MSVCSSTVPSISQFCPASLAKVPRNLHREASRVGAGGGWPADELQAERVGFSGGVGEGHVVEDHLHGVVGYFVVAETAGFGNVVDVHLTCGALVRLRPPMPPW